MSFVSCSTSHFGLWPFPESKEHDLKGLKDSDWQLNVDLAQLVEHWHDDPEVLGSIPTRGNF